MQRFPLLGLVLAAILVAASTWATGHGFARAETGQARSRAEASAKLYNAHLQSELERFRALPLVLARDPDILGALAEPSDERSAVLNRKFAELATETHSDAIYAVAVDGLTLAASNWAEPDSFVGANYAFRPYFREALLEGSGELFALGTLSRRPGLFLAQRVQNAAGQALGVVVVKVLFDALEARWRDGEGHAFVAESTGIVLITSRPEWRFNTLRRLPATEVAQLRAEQRFGADAAFPLLPLRLAATDLGSLDAPGAAVPGEYAVARVSTDVPDWTLYVLLPAGAVVTTARNTGRLVGGALATLLVTLGFALAARARRNRIEAARRADAQHELEQRVADRTRELSDANDRLLHEMDERRRTEARVHQMQDELIQATKLAVLGQVTAGVAHEINQPLAAMRSFADNAGVLLGRGDLVRVQDNLRAVTQLADRIGLITRELRAFARKGNAGSGPVRVGDALDGALLLLAARLRSANVCLIVEPFDRQTRVVSERTRLEQVLVNLLQNAIDAASGAAHPEVHVQVRRFGARVEIEVADNGPGLTEEVRAVLFTPFVSTKPDGLGLGLVISRDIVAEFDGSLRYAQAPTGGAAFIVDLAVA